MFKKLNFKKFNIFKFFTYFIILAMLLIVFNYYINVSYSNIMNNFYTEFSSGNFKTAKEILSDNKISFATSRTSSSRLVILEKDIVEASEKIAEAVIIRNDNDNNDDDDSESTHH